MTHALIFRTGALGDFVATLPVLSRLREVSDHLTVVAPSRYAVLFETADRWVDSGGLEATRLLAGTSDTSEFDVGVAWTHIAADALRRSGVRLVVEGTPRPAPGVSIYDHLWEPLRELGLGPRDRDARLVPDTAARARIEARLVEAGFREARPVVISPGSGGERKRWPIANWSEVTAKLERPAVWVAGPLEADEPGFCEPCLRDLDLRGLVALASCSEAWLAPDSGPAHLAAAAGARVGVVFTGVTAPENWVPPGAHAFAADASPDDVVVWATRR